MSTNPTSVNDDIACKKIRIEPLYKTEVSGKQKKVALLIGITNYRTLIQGNREHSINLRGPVNDVALMQTLLFQYGFAAEDIEILTSDGPADRQPTRHNILKALDDLGARTSQDAVVFFFYAGHGSQLQYEIWQNDEFKALVLADKPPQKMPNELVDTIVPCDDRHHKDPDLQNGVKITQITDYELHKKFESIAALTKNITIVFDCCHSENLLRKPEEANERRKPMFEFLPLSLRNATSPRVRGFSHHPGSHMPFLASQKAFVLFAACRQEESALEHICRKDGKVHGLWSRAFITGIENAQASQNNYFSNEQLFESACVALSLVCPSHQHPTIKGARARAFLGLDELRSDQVAVVREAEVDEETNLIMVKLSADGVNNTEAGCIYALCAHGCRRYDATMEMARAEVIDADAVASIGKVVSTNAGDLDQPKPKDLLGLPVFDLKQGEGRLRPLVAVDVVVPELEAFAGNKDIFGSVSRLCQEVGVHVNASPLLTNVSAKHDYKVFLRIVDKSSAIVSSKQPIPVTGPAGAESITMRIDELAITKPYFVVLDAKGQKASVKQMPATREGLEKLKQTLDSIGRFHRGMSACYRPVVSTTENPLFDKITLTLEVKPKGAMAYTKLDGIADCVVCEGDQMMATIQNLSTTHVHVGLLEFAEDGQVHMLLPRETKSIHLPAGSQPVVLGENHLNPISFNPETCIQPVATWKLFACTRSLDFSALTVQENQRGFDGSFDDDDSLQSLLGQASAFRVFTRKLNLAKEHWITVEKSFRVGSRASSN